MILVLKSLHLHLKIRRHPRQTTAGDVAMVMPTWSLGGLRLLILNKNLGGTRSTNACKLQADQLLTLNMVTCASLKEVTVAHVTTV